MGLVDPRAPVDEGFYLLGMHPAAIVNGGVGVEAVPSALGTPT